MGYIYEIINRKTNKALIGQTTQVNPRSRWVTHRGRLRKGVHTNPYLQNAWNKYGEDAFVFESSYVPNEHLDHMEWMLIPFWGHYNLREGGGANGGRLKSPETIEKLRQAAKRQWAEGRVRKNYKHSKETREQLSKSHKGQVPYNKGTTRPEIAGGNNPACRPEVRKKISEARMGHGHPTSKETRLKLSKALKRFYGSLDTEV